MFTVLECVAVQHDREIVLLAALICLLGMLAFFHLLLRAEESPSGRKPYWVLVAAFAAGLSVWATHFVAMLAYKGTVPIGFDFYFTRFRRFLPYSASGWRLPPALRQFSARSSPPPW
jgi:NO-binding membrane sensor protein with MHYT domain